MSGVLLICKTSQRYDYEEIISVKGSVQRKLRWVENTANRWVLACIGGHLDR